MHPTEEDKRFAEAARGCAELVAALRKRNEQLERVAEAARETVVRRNEGSNGQRVKRTPWRDAAGKPFYIVDAGPADRLMAALAALDKEE